MDDDEAVPTTFILPNRDQVAIDAIDALPQIGDGIYSEKIAYRVVDLWFVDDGQTPLPYGWVVFLEQAPDEGNRLLAFNAEYFGN